MFDGCQTPYAFPYIFEIVIRNFSNGNKSLLNRQLEWELLKYEVRKFTIKYTKHVAKEKTATKNKFRKSVKKTLRKVG